jgi:hypothetical protein
VAELSIEQSLTLSPESGSSDGTTIRTAVRGELALTVVHRDDSGFVLVGELNTPSVDVRPPDALTSQQLRLFAASLNTPFALHFSPNGAFSHAACPEEAHELARGLWRTLGSVIQVSARPNTHELRWTAREADPVGAFDARYAIDDHAHITKTRGEYLPAAHASPLPSGVRVATFAWAGQVSGGFVQHLQFRETLDVAWSEESVAQHAATLSLRATQEEFSPQLAAQLATLADELHPAPLAVSQSSQELAQAHDRQRAGDASATTLLANIARLAVHTEASEARALEMERLAARLRLTPQAATEVAAWAAAADRTPEETATAVGALEAAATPAAQQTLHHIAQNLDATLDARQNAIAALGSLPPTSANVDALLQLSQDNELPIAQASLLALGAAARSGDEEATAAIHQALERAATPDDQRVSLEAAGNAADPNALPAIEAALHSADPSVRRAAVEALRFVDHPKALPLIVATLSTDAAGHVRLGAIFALSFRPEPGAIEAIVRAALQDPEPAVRIAAVTELGPRLIAQPALAYPLRQVAAHDPDAQVRDTATAWLATPQGT